MRVTLIIVLAACSIALAQSATIEDIRDHYNDVKDNLDDYYMTILVINSEERSYPALGNYIEEITFYWGSEAGASWPVLVTYSSEYAARNEYGEVLFSEPAEPWEGNLGELQFQYVSFDNTDDNLSEIRWWYSGGELLDSAGSTSYSDGSGFEYTPTIPDDYDYAQSPSGLWEMFYTIHK